MDAKTKHFEDTAGEHPDIVALAAVAEGASEVCRTLSNPQRLRILCALNAGACCVSQLEQRLGVSQAYMSGQLARMRAEGLVECQRVGRQMLYSIADQRVQVVLIGLAAAVRAMSAQNQANDNQHQPQE